MRMTPAEQQAAYRATCSHKRVGQCLVCLKTGASKEAQSVNVLKRDLRLGAFQTPGQPYTRHYLER